MKRILAVSLSVVMIFCISMNVTASDLETRVQELETKVSELEAKISYFEELLSQLGMLETQEEIVVESEAAEATIQTGEMTMGQKNALSSAKQYLGFMSFSYSGIIDQLEYEGYSTEDATFAADNCGADWNEQAVKTAEQYLEFMSFSREGLMEQLEYDGFTNAQATQAVSAVGY